MGKSINDRMKSAPDAVWEGVLRKHKSLGAPPFSPPLTPILKAYHGNFQKYVDFLDEKKRLKAMLDDYVAKSREFGTKITTAFDELAKIQDKDQKSINESLPKLSKFTGDPKADTDEPSEALGVLADAGGNLVTLRKALWDQINKLADQKMALTKKVRDDFKTKADVIKNGVKKLETDADAQEAQARKILTNYEAIAVKQEHDDWVGEISSVADAF